MAPSWKHMKKQKEKQNTSWSLKERVHALNHNTHRFHRGNLPNSQNMIAPLNFTPNVTSLTSSKRNLRTPNLLCFFTTRFFFSFRKIQSQILTEPHNICPKSESYLSQQLIQTFNHSPAPLHNNSFFFQVKIIKQRDMIPLLRVLFDVLI